MMYMFILFTNYRFTTAVWCFSGRKTLSTLLQFHGIDGKCVTFNKATQSGVRDLLDWVSIFKETAEALDFMHKKGFLHNDLKSDKYYCPKKTMPSTLLSSILESVVT